MISDEKLKEAALELDEALLSSLPDRGEWEYSTRFKRKMSRLFCRGNTPRWKVYCVRAAVILLAVLLLGGSVLVASPGARASFLELFDVWTTMNWIYFGHSQQNNGAIYSHLAKQENEDIPVLRLVCLVNSGDLSYFRHKYHENAILELNQMLAERDLPYRIEVVVYNSDDSYDISQKTLSWQEGIETADIIYADFTVEQIPEYLIPITEYATGVSKPSLENAVIHDYNWLSSTMDGEIYGICTQPSRSFGHGWQIDTGFLTNNGLTVEDLSKPFWEMDELFAKLYEANGYEPFLYYDSDGCYLSGKRTTSPKDRLAASKYMMDNSIATALPLGGICDAVEYDSFQPIGACFAIDFAAEKPTVVNMLETDRVRNIQQAYARYRKAGYTTTDESQNKLCYIQVYSSETYVHGAYTYIPMTDTLMKSCNGQNMLGISKTTDHMEDALSFLKLITEDEEIRWQLCYGKEDRDYIITNNVFYNSKYKEEEELVWDLGIHNFDMLTPLNYFYGIPTEQYASTPRPMYYSREGMTALETYYEDVENLDHCFYPIQFDYSEFDYFGEGKELLKLGEVMGNYYYMFSSPKMTEEIYEQMLQAMKEAGSDRIIAELQRQLDTWIAEHPEWNPLG